MVYWDRFISYIFRYHNFSKCENTGFAKVQKMSGHGKMYINLKDRINGNGVYSVYFYRETLHEDEASEPMLPVLLYMGKIILRNGRGEGTLSFDWENVRASGRPVTAWSGIIIKKADAENSEYDIFCSSWTDNEVDYSYAFAETKTEKENRISRQDMFETGHPNGTNFVINEMRGHKENAYKNDDTGMKNANEIEETHEKSNPAEDEIEENDIKEDDVEKNISEQDEENYDDEPRITAAEILATMKSDSRADELLESREKLPLLPNYSGDEKGVVSCVKINPNDIGLLNMDNWRLGVNSFLTHGFYNYKYLMLGRVEFDGDTDACYILGVPGEYSSKEKYLANIFGFDRFIPVQETKIKTGSFGYWVVDLK